MYCDHCQTNVVDDATDCPSCGGALTASDAYDPSQAPTVALTVGPCESCGAPSLPGSTLCLPCTRAFESILNAQPTAPMPAPPAGSASFQDAPTVIQPPAPVLPSAPGAFNPDATTILAPAAGAEPLADDDEYEDDDDLMGEEEATVLSVPAPPVPPPAQAAAEPAATFTATDAPDWSTPSTTSGEHRTIVALPPWARKGPDADSEPAAEAQAAAPEPPAAEPVPWWERNGHASPTAAAKPETNRYVPPPAVAPPASASLESTLARQAMRPKTPSIPVAAPVVTRPAAGNRNRTMLLAAGLAGIAAIGTPVAWRLAFADKPNTVSALQYEPIAAAPQPTAPRPERVHGAPAPAPAPAPRVYQDLQPVAPEPAPVAAAARTTTAPTQTARPKRPTTTATHVPEPVAAAPVAAPEPEPLLVATPPPVVAAAATAAPPPAPVQAEAVPLGQIYEISQVESRPAVTNRYDPVLPARITATSPVVVIVRVLVSPSGRAVESTAVKNPTNDAGVAAAATATVRQWGFSPAKKKGQAVSCWVNVGVVFKSAAGN